MTGTPASLAVRLGAIALAVAAVAFVGVFSWLAAAFDYPAVLDGRAADVLPALLSMGGTGRAVWAVYALLPLLLLPGGVAVALAFPASGAARLGPPVATVSALAMTLGLARWSTVHWTLASAYVAAGPTERGVIAAVFDGLNLYLGNAIGEFVGELALYGVFAVVAVAAWRDSRFPAWFGRAVLAVAVAGWVAMFRNVTAIVDPVNEVANVLLPVGLVGLGLGLARWGARPPHAAVQADPSSRATSAVRSLVPWG